MLFPSPQSPPQALRVAVTGTGVITSLGIGWKENAAGFRAGRNGLAPVTLFDVSRQRAKIAGQVSLPSDLPATRLSRREESRLDRAARLLLIAAHEAWVQAGWTATSNLPVVLGTTSGGMSLGEAYYRCALDSPKSNRHQPSRVMNYLVQAQPLSVAKALGFSGPISLIANACASGANAIGHAWELLRSGRCQRVLTGGYDALSHMVFSGFDSLQALSTTQCRPFDANRDGLALGEGAGILALETLAHAQQRGAKILGEIVGYAATLDTHHLTQPHPQGDAALASMTLATSSASLSPTDIDYVNAHGTGTPMNDVAEAHAITRWAGARASTLPVSSTKSSVGHLLGAAGAVEALVCLMALQEQWLPPTPTFRTPDAACGFPVVQKPAVARLNHAMSNSFGFGGANATLILRRWR